MKSKKGCILSILFVFFIFGVTIPLFMTNHKKIKADTITDLTYSTWVINADYGTTELTTKYINFTSNNTDYTYMSMTYYDGDYNLRYDWDVIAWYPGSFGWFNYDRDKTIYITGGNDVTNQTLIDWLNAHAVLQGYNPPTPPGTQITHKYWAPWGVIRMTDNQVVGDNDIEYIVLFNEQRRQYDETTQTGLIFKGMITTDNVPQSYIESINGPGINILYKGDSNNLSNVMWLEFTYGDYMDTDLYNFMDLWGLWFDDGDPYVVGMNQGYVEGYDVGRAAGQADGTEYTGLVTGIFNGLGSLLSIQVFPNITIGLLIGLPLLLGVLVIVIKVLRG